MTETFEYEGLSFEWDPKKSDGNLAKQGVAFVDAATSFADPHATVVSDRSHSHSEERWHQIATSAAGQVLITGYTQRDPHIRIISARPATRRERHDYLEGQPRRRRHP